MRMMSCPISVALGLVWLALSVAVQGQTHQMLRVDRGEIEVVFASASSQPLRDLIMQRLTTSAEAVTAYYGQYPVAHLQIDVRFHPGHGVNSGKAFGWNGARIALSVGAASTASDFANDWVTTHEMVHLAFPSVDERHHWIQEGQAVYIEPVARARIGELTPEKVWGDMVDAMPQGLPAEGDRGLDFTHTWGRTYWGGAIFCLLADVEIRRRTHNQKGLEHALRAILASGGTIESQWPLERAIEIGDRAVGVPVLHELYQRMNATPVKVDLNSLWQKLGVERHNGQTVLDDSAPLAAIRRAITEPVGQARGGL
jgi:hypothetical protein